MSLERLATLVLSIPEGVVERRTAVHPVRAFTSIGRDCVGCFVGTWKGDCLGSSSRGQPRGALPLHQVTQRQVIKFADPTRRSGHTTCYTRCIGVCASSSLLMLYYEDQAIQVAVVCYIHVLTSIRPKLQNALAVSLNTVKYVAHISLCTMQ